MKEPKARKIRAKEPIESKIQINRNRKNGRNDIVNVKPIAKTMREINEGKILKIQSQKIT